MTELKAIEGCKKQDRISQKYLFDAYSEAMLMVCLRYVKNLADAEELMLNGFFSFFKSIDRFVQNGTRSIAPWLKQIMVNECLMFLRKKGALKIVEVGDAADVSLEADAIETIGAGEILKILLELPVGYRTVMNLFIVEGYTHKEIAQMLDISEGTSKSQLAKGRAMLQQMITQKGVFYGK